MSIALGIDIGGTNIKLAFISDDFILIKSFSLKTKNFKSFTDFAYFLKDIISKFEYNKQLVGIGIGAPNGNFYTGKIENAPNLNWEKTIEVKDIVEQITGLKTILINDANAVALAEHRLGYGKMFKNFVLITIGTGLGCGIILNNQIINGANGIAGELGHTTIIHNGRKCTCGNYGCLETYVSIRGIKQTFVELGGDNLSPFYIAVEAKKGNKTAIETYKKTGYYLALGIKNFIHILDIEAVIFFGGIAKSFELFKPAMVETLNDILLPSFKNKQKFLHSKLNRYGGAIGAACLIF